MRLRIFKKEGRGGRGAPIEEDLYYEENGVVEVDDEVLNERLRVRISRKSIY